MLILNNTNRPLFFVSSTEKDDSLLLTAYDKPQPTQNCQEVPPGEAVEITTDYMTFFNKSAGSLLVSTKIIKHGGQKKICRILSEYSEYSG